MSLTPGLIGSLTTTVEIKLPMGGGGKIAVTLVVVLSSFTKSIVEGVEVRVIVGVELGVFVSVAVGLLVNVSVCVDVEVTVQFGEMVNDAVAVGVGEGVFVIE